MSVARQDCPFYTDSLHRVPDSTRFMSSLGNYSYSGICEGCHHRVIPDDLNGWQLFTIDELVRPS